ncbi:immunity protein YezG family protein [Fulvimarina sp. MAC3]|uniref:immunity protein YezG family protein n=1 Tax=Fulvimarina sp. MAC3 TaxID=3148887 RepID=UPI0031FC7DC7
MTSWKDEAIENYALSVSDMVIGDIGERFTRIVALGRANKDASSISIIYYDLEGYRRSPEGFFDYADDLNKIVNKFHSKFQKNNEDWRASLLTLDADGTFDLKFEYDDPYRWELHKFDKTLQ